MRDGDRDRPQPSPAALIGWQFVQNPTSLTTQQQILKAYMQPPPSVLRCLTASEPGAQRSTLIRAVVLLLPLSAGLFSFKPPGRLLTAPSLIISPGGKRPDKEL